MPMSVYLVAFAVLMLSITLSVHAQFGFGGFGGGYDMYGGSSYGMGGGYGRSEWLMDDPFKAGRSPV